MSVANCLLLPSKLEGITPLQGTEIDHTAVWQFEESLKAAWGCYPYFSDEIKCNFIRQNLGNIPLGELRFHSVINDPEKIFKVLHHAFGDKRTWGQMLQYFIGISQLPNEPVRVFSHRLMYEWQAIERAQLQRECKIVTNSLLIDIFVTGLNDSVLKKFLREDIYDDPNISIYKLREKAIRWEEVQLVVKEPTNEDSGVSLCTEVTDHTNQQIEESLAHMCIKLDAIVNNIIAQASSFPKRRRRKKKRRTAKDKMPFENQVHQTVTSHTSECSLAQDSKVAHSMSAHVGSLDSYPIPSNLPTDNKFVHCDEINEISSIESLLQTDCVTEKSKETIFVNNCDVWALHGEKGKTMTFLKENSGCKINISKAEGDRSKGLRNVEIVGTKASIEKAKLLIKDTCGVEVISSL